MRILLALDTSTQAMDEAVRLARERGADLTALFVLDATWNVYIGHDWLSGSNARASFLDYIKDEEHKAAAATLEIFRQRAGDLPVELKTAAGDVTDEILQELASGAYDLLVMANPFSRGLETMRDPAAKIARKTPVSVMLVKQ